MFSRPVLAQAQKDPGLACFFSVVIPGVGQYYNGTENEVLKGILQDIGFVSGALLMSAGNVTTLSGPQGLFDHPGGASTGGVLGLGLAGGSYIWSVIDAPLSSDQINREPPRPKPVSVLEENGSKSPVLSFFLSAVIPGSGQYYNGTPGEITKGVVQEVGIIGPLIFNRFNYDDRGADFAELFMICGSYLWSIIDAPLSSADINRELARRKQAISPFNTRLTLLTDSAFHLVPGAEISLRF